MGMLKMSRFEGVFVIFITKQSPFLDCLILKIKATTILRNVEKYLPVNIAQLLIIFKFSQNHFENLVLQEVNFGL